MRIAYDREELAGCVKFAQAEAEAAFGIPGVYLERYFKGVRHVEVQVLVDEQGYAVQLGRTRLFCAARASETHRRITIAGSGQDYQPSHGECSFTRCRGCRVYERGHS